MANTFFGLTIGSSGLFASNAAINTTAHKIPKDIPNRFPTSRQRSLSGCIRAMER